MTCEHLTRRFGDRTAVDDVSFSVAPGETYGLLGPNGAGKTTTIKLICGLLAADGGTVTVAGHPQSPTRTDAKALVGYVPQDVALYPDLSARENLRFFGRLFHLRGKALAVSRALTAHGIQPGDKVAIWAPNCIDWVLAALVNCGISFGLDHNFS